MAGRDMESDKPLADLSQQFCCPDNITLSKKYKFMVLFLRKMDNSKTHTPKKRTSFVGGEVLINLKGAKLKPFQLLS